MTKKNKNVSSDRIVEKEGFTLNRRQFMATSVATAGLVVPGIVTAASNAAAATTSSGPVYSTQSDTWVTPWEFRQSDWPGQQLTLNVVEHAAPVALFGDVNAAADANVGQLLFSWNGISPAPTMRIGGDEILHVKVRNMLGPNNGDLNIPTGKVPHASVTTAKQWVDGGFTKLTPDYCRPIHTNHKHQIRTTNIHFHGSHVSPYQNTDGSHSDDIYLRIVPQGDYLLREATQDPECWPYKGSEVSGEADYQYRLGKTARPQRINQEHESIETHPPGTHWYHPHAHGSTFTQVASGMAGLIIVEGDVDEALKSQLDPTNEGTTYSERPIVIQRIVGPTAVDLEASFQNEGQTKTRSPSSFPAVNGQSLTIVSNFMVINPGAIERWRILNAAVDGQSYLDFEVREGDGATISDGQPYTDTLFHLASDGVTLVNEAGDYHMRRLTNKLMMAPANRADLLFQAPELTDAEKNTGYKLFSIWVSQPESSTDKAQSEAPLKIATIIVRGDSNPPMENGRPINLGSYSLDLPSAPDYLKPVTDNDIKVKRGDPDYNEKTVNSGSRANNNGKCRGRRVIYSGWGGGGFPDTGTNRKNELIAYNGNPIGSASDTGTVSGAESMMVDCRKFNDDPDDLNNIAHHMLIETAEEWTVSNMSLTLFTNDPKGKPPSSNPNPDPRVSGLGANPYPTTEQKDNKSITTRAVDHPFHIHINPFWVVGIYDWEGKQLGWNYERLEDGDEFYPRWHDVIRLPRNGGKVVFRSRFWDFAGEYVNHCHILQHEDNGMMQGVAVVLEPGQADYIPFSAGEDFPDPSWLDCYTLCWGIGGKKETVAAANRRACDDIKAKLRTLV